jgi:acyl carrier protein
MEKFYKGMSEIFEVELATISNEFDLNESNWDSLAIISTIALVDNCFGRILSGNDLYNCKNIGDIIKLTERK